MAQFTYKKTTESKSCSLLPELSTPARLTQTKKWSTSKFLDATPCSERVHGESPSFILKSTLSPFPRQNQLTSEEEFYRIHKTKCRTQGNDIYSKMIYHAQLNDLRPKKLSIIGSKSLTEVSLNGPLSHNYFEMFLHGLSSIQYKNIQSLELHNISQQNLLDLSTKMPKTLIKLNLSSNRIHDGKVVAQILVNSTLRELDLSQNKITDKALLEILTVLQNIKTLTYLNLSYNQITDLHMRVFGNIMSQNQSIQELYLKFNLIRGRQGFYLIEGIVKNATLKVFDISYNKLGNESVPSLCKLISRPHPELVHLDISHNGFNMEQVQILAKELAFNQVIYGFHLEGCGVQNNARGFLQARKSEHSVELAESEQNCWICQGWNEIRFLFRKPSKAPIFLHLDFEDYRPCLMEEIDEHYEIFRMCPPKTSIKFFFTDPTHAKAYFSKDYPLIQSEQYIFEGNLEMKYSDGTIVQYHPLHQINQIQTGIPQKIIDRSRHYYNNINCKPRQPEKIVEIHVQTDTEWSVAGSIFKDYIEDSQTHLRECLQFDLSQSKLFKKQSTAEVTEQLLPYYSLILQTYKYYCALSLNQDFPKINMSIISNFPTQYFQMKNTDWDILLLSTMSVRQSYTYIHDRSLVRYQFIEIILRVLKELKLSISEGFQTIFKQIAEGSTEQIWREERYWTQIMDITIQFKMPLIKALFQVCQQFTTKNTKYIKIQDFRLLCEDLLTEEEIHHVFLQSMMTQKDELNQSRHFEMQFIEFIEALARLAEKLSPNSPFYKEKKLNLIQRKILPMYIKFEGLLYILFYKHKARIPQSNLEITIVTRSVLSSTELKMVTILDIDPEEGNDDEQDHKYLFDSATVIQNLLYNPKHVLRHKLSRKTLVVENNMEELRKAQMQNDQMDLETYDSSDGLEKLQATHRRSLLKRFTLNIMKRSQFKYEDL